MMGQALFIANAGNCVYIVCSKRLSGFSIHFSFSSLFADSAHRKDVLNCGHAARFAVRERTAFDHANGNRADQAHAAVAVLKDKQQRHYRYEAEGGAVIAIDLNGSCRAK